MAELILSEKYKAFLRCSAPVEFLEGTTAAGKTTVALFKFMLRVAESPKKLHVLSGLDPVSYTHLVSPPIAEPRAPKLRWMKQDAAR